MLAVSQMSNHLHLVVEDQLGEISDFMQYFLGHAAKRLNRVDQVRGAVFERRFAEIVVLDEDAVAKRIAYAVNNPVEASLVRSISDWTGLCLYAEGAATVHTFSVFNESAYVRALGEAERTGAAVNPGDYVEQAHLEVAGLGEAMAGRVAAAVAQREAQLQSEQEGVAGMGRVLESSPFDRPRMSSRSAMPLCFGSTREVRQLFVAGWRAFVTAFRLASSAFRSGLLDVGFPPYSFRPGLPVGDAGGG